jgi:hypothetical protein
MAFFGSPKPVHPRFELPKVSPRECTEMSLPNIHSITMLNLRWLEWQAKRGQDTSYWWTRIFDSEEFWSSPNIDLGQYAFNIALKAATLENLSESKEIIDDLFVHAKLGILSGMFERASNTTSPRDCHPLIWNAMKFFQMDARKMPEQVEIPKESPVLRESTTWAGYAFGKIPNITIEQVFSKWR